jgi:hypothetical protein
LYGLTTTGVADARRRVGRLVGVVHQLLARHREAEVGEQAVRLLLVARDLDGDVRGAPVTVAWMRCWCRP